MYVLGISAFYHDSAASLVKDGEIIAAVQEERFSRKKNDPRFPRQAIQYCLEEAEIEPEDLKAVIFYDSPVLTFDRIMKTMVDVGSKALEPWVKGAPGWLSAKLFVKKLIKEELKYDVCVLFAEHHFSHAASAFYPSPFNEATILTIDGVGEWSTLALGYGDSKGIHILREIHFPHSLGLLYSAFTQFCGFKVNFGEYKLMGLAPYGEPKYVDIIKRELIDIKDDGSFRLNMKYFGYLDSLVMTNENFHKLFGGPPRERELPITKREMDLAASIQRVTEEVVLKLCRHARELTGKKNICLAGGVALNCVANGKLLLEKMFNNIWIQPAAGDAGGSLGAALLAMHEYFNVPRPKADSKRDSQKGSYLGPGFSNAEIKAFLDNNGYPYREVSDDERAMIVAKEITNGKIVGYMVGRMEFGPRALGARSILGDAQNTKTQSVMNLKIKYRESFRPFAPSVLAKRCSDYFELDVLSPYMLLVAPVRKERRLQVEKLEPDNILEIVNQTRSDIPAVTHVDYSARIQTVDAREKPDYYQLIKEFEKLTGYGVIVNTSFNVRGEPIVCTPQDAYKCFMRTEMDMLVMENQILYKNEQPEFKDVENWRDEYELD
ncbi:carbamoyltransferase [candidate division WOR-3 bacterium]|nr:carbamoyltransferase [candidate division WOR-3 bacterium]